MATRRDYRKYIVDAVDILSTRILDNEYILAN